MAWGKKRSFKKKVRRTFKKRVRKVPLKKLVKKIMRQQVETKSLQMFNENQSVYSVANPTQYAGGLAIIPLGLQPGSLSLFQGLGDGQRVGNKMNLVSARVKGCIVPNPYNATTNPTPKPLQVKLFFFYNKLDSSSTPNPPLDFYQNGTGVAGFTNSLIDLWRPINTNKYRVLTTRSFKLGYAKYDGTGFSSDNQAYSNNSFKLNCNFSVNLGKLIQKSYNYNDNSADPAGRHLWMMFVTAWADDSAMADTYIPAQYTMMQELKYKDA